jgi:hypothetical protein
MLWDSLKEELSGSFTINLAWTVYNFTCNVLMFLHIGKIFPLLFMKIRHSIPRERLIKHTWTLYRSFTWNVLRYAAYLTERREKKFRLCMVAGKVWLVLYQIICTLPWTIEHQRKRFTDTPARTHTQRDTRTHARRHTVHRLIVGAVMFPANSENLRMLFPEIW